MNFLCTTLFRNVSIGFCLLTFSTANTAQVPFTGSAKYALKQTASTIIKKTQPKPDAASGAAKSKAALRTGTTSYQAKIESGTQTVKVTTKRTITEEGGAWVITEIAQSQQGQARDQITLEKASLKPLKRSVKQGPMMLDLVFKEDKVIGTMTTNGNTNPVDIDISGPVFSDGAGFDAYISTLPLAVGYTTTLSIFNLQKLKPQNVQLSVTGSERVTVPAGTFEAFKLSSKSLESDLSTTEYWIAKETRKVLKAVLSLPQAGVTITAELMP
ncbi:MAG TPA: hypothetical protein VEF04_00740 [Blastocatellia bacterium]|nr:hypothetical protein [Blastocatellia bacterium]